MNLKHSSAGITCIVHILSVYNILMYALCATTIKEKFIYEAKSISD